SDATHYSFSGHLNSAMVAGYGASNVDVTLSNDGTTKTLTFEGDVTLPLVDKLHVSGNYTDATHYSFSGHLNSAMVAGFGASNVDVTLSNDGTTKTLTFEGDVSLPLVTTVHASGNYSDATHYSFSGHLNSAMVAG